MRRIPKTPSAPIVDIAYKNVTPRSVVVVAPALNPEAKNFLFNLLTGFTLATIALTVYQVIY